MYLLINSFFFFVEEKNKWRNEDKLMLKNIFSQNMKFYVLQFIGPLYLSLNYFKLELEK